MKIVVNTMENFPTDAVVCQCCRKKLTDIVNDCPVIPYTELYKSGCIPVPNFGWICSQECAERFEREAHVKFARTEKGKIDYYNGSLE